MACPPSIPSNTPTFFCFFARRMSATEVANKSSSGYFSTIL